MMKDKKHMVIAGVAVLAVVLVAGVAVGRNRSIAENVVEEDIKSSELTHGIHYGGNFNEFQNLSKQDLESDDLELEPEASKELLMKELEESKKNNPGDIYGEEGGKIRQRDDLPEGEAPTLEDNTEEEIDETVFTGSVDIPIYTSKGYAEHEVICDAQSQEEAESIASQISGTLLSWENGVAIIQISDSVDKFLELYEQQGGEMKFYKRFY